MFHLFKYFKQYKKETGVECMCSSPVDLSSYQRCYRSRYVLLSLARATMLFHSSVRVSYNNNNMKDDS